MWHRSSQLIKCLKGKFYSKAAFSTPPSRKLNLELKEMKKPPELGNELENITQKTHLDVLKIKNESLHFDEIPGPTSLKMFSKIWSLFPILGTETTTQVIRYFLLKDRGKEPNQLMFKRVFEQYGPIVKLDGIIGSDVILLCRPEHACVAFNCEKTSHWRNFFDSLEKYRQNSKSYQKNGPFLKLDHKWASIRKFLQESKLSVYKEISLDKSFSNQFVKKIYDLKNLQDELPNSLKIELYKWSLDCLSMALFKTDFGFMNQHFLTPSSDPGRLFDGIIGATNAIRKLEFGFHYWKFGDTPTFQSLAKNCDLIDIVLSKNLNKTMKTLSQKKDKKQNFTDISLVESLLMQDDLDEEDIMTILLDTILISANAASHIVATVCFHLAKNPRCQIKLLEEIIRKGEIVTFDTINKRYYLNGCIKECLRLDPPIPIVSRQLEHDLVLNHYRIPKGTYVLYSTHLNSNREEYFEDATRFKPERWLSGDLGEFGREYQAFATVCLGFGPDANIIKDIMYLHIAKLVVKIVSKFKIEYNFGSSSSQIEFLAPNHRAMRLKFVNRLK